VPITVDVAYDEESQYNAYLHILKIIFFIEDPSKQRYYQEANHIIVHPPSRHLKRKEE
jgi:hypothetical protein